MNDVFFMSGIFFFLGLTTGVVFVVWMLKNAERKYERKLKIGGKQNENIRV
jgi:hypothetical protein